MPPIQPLNRILLVDDDRTTNHVNQRILSSCGVAHHIDVRLNGQEALDYLTTPLENGQYPAPAIIFLDLKMPVMDGFDFMARYQGLLPEQKAQVLFILSSAAGFYDRERLKTYADIIRILDKPLEPVYLMDLMSEHFGQ